MPPTTKKPDHADLLATALDLAPGLGLDKLVEAAIAKIAAVPEPAPAPKERVGWKAALVEAVDALPDGGSWKAHALHEVIATEAALAPALLEDALKMLRGRWTGKLAVPGGEPVATALRAMGWSVARVTPDGDVIVRARS